MAHGHLIPKTWPVKLFIWSIGYRNPSQGGVHYKAQGRWGGEDGEPAECGSYWSLHPKLVDVGRAQL